MNVLFDHQAFSFQEYGGISLYFCNLLRQFSRMEGINPDIIIKHSNSTYLPYLNFTGIRKFSASFRFRGRNDLIRLLNQSYFKKTLPAKSRPNIFHPTYYNPYFLSIIGDIPFVLTVYDMSHELFPDSFSLFDFASKNKKILASKASRIIAISENTKKDIIKFLEIPESKIDVTPLATDLSTADAKKPSATLPDRFILYVGKRNTYKNFNFLLKTLSKLRIFIDKYSLLCIGGGSFNKKEIDEINRLGLKDKILQMNADDNELAYIYSRAKALVYPSLYEGFGIPVLEAFACGCPAIISNRSSLPEVGGEAAQYFDPEKSGDLAAKLIEVLENESLAKEMISAGKERVKLFSWEKTAIHTFETYKKALGHH